MNPQDLRLTVRDLQLALRVWGPADGAPVLALHGWLDNAASFDRLAPLLTAHRVYCLDLPGHGHSGHRPVQGSYNIWDDLPDLVALADALELDRFVLLGHSRGGIIASLLAAVLKARVTKLVMLDAVYPPPMADADAPAQLRRFAVQYALPSGAPRRFASVDEAVDARCQATGSAADCVRPIVERNLLADGEGWLWRTDPRLRLASALKLNEAQIRAILADISADALLILARGGFGARPEAAQVRELFPDLRLRFVDGDHDCHQRLAAEEIAEMIDGFLAEA